MLIMKQGNIADPRKIKELEDRIEMLENALKALQSEQRPKMGRPPKGANELKKTEVNH